MHRIVKDGLISVLCGGRFACHDCRQSTGGQRCAGIVSIGAVLVAGVLAGGDVAGVAAPSPQNQLNSPAPGRQSADKETTPSVDVELILAVDVSYSMDMDELAIQREGYAQAIVSKEFCRR